MSKTAPVHDNILLGYEVDSINGFLTLHTEYPHSRDKEKIDVIFEGVLAYHFEGDLLPSILFEIEETNLDSALEQHASLVERRAKHGWPKGWNHKKESLNEYLDQKGLKVFTLMSSYGLDGLVFANSMRTQQVD